MEFFKYQACGNDYVYIDCFKKVIKNPGELAKKISNRNFAVGSDGLILILPSSSADAKMRIFNSDGSEGEMCGNGIRCVAKYIFDNQNKGSGKNVVTIETLSGIKKVELLESSEKISKVRVSMGEPSFFEISCDEKIKEEDCVKEYICLSVGNPHCVLFCDDIFNIDIEKIGTKIQNSGYFENGVNVEFVEIESDRRISVRVFERGSGETLACGTGACAAAVGSVSKGFCNNDTIVKLRGGELEIEYTDNLIYMTGEAVKVFKGEYYE